jgi:hypothetical protein
MSLEDNEILKAVNGNNGKHTSRLSPLRLAETKPATSDADDPEALFKDTDRLHVLAEMYVNDFAGYSAEEARLKKRGVPIKRLSQLISRMAAPIRTANIKRGNEAARPAREPYFVAGNITYKAGGSSADIPLCNFAARVIAEVTTDDGAECRRRLRLVGRLDTGEELPEIEVPVERFATMEWPMNQWGTRAVVAAGSGSRDHLRAAILKISENVRCETEYAHTGWREVGGHWVYLHARGAIGADGPAAGVCVSISRYLPGYTLPDPPVGEQLRAAVRASLGILFRNVAPDEVMFPVLLAVYRAPLGGADYGLSLVGRTGTGKSELAALSQQHYGAGLDARHLPANWISTANSNEAFAFVAKDALLVIDDYCPTSPAETVKLNAAADRLFRGQGNHAGRSRMTAGGEIRAGKPPRGLLFSTGEDSPGGASLRARLWTVEVAHGSVDFTRLSECQAEAAAGRYAEALAGFIRWIAADYVSRRDRLRAEVARRRAELLGTGGHTRVPTTAADLLATLDVLLEFAVSTGAFTRAEAEELRTRGRSAMLATAEAQSEHQRETNPAERFISLLTSVLSSGRAHLVDKTGDCPDEQIARAAGWRNDRDGWNRQGRPLGWIVGERVYLDPEAAIAEVTKLANEQAQPLVVAGRTLWRHLHEAGHLSETAGSSKKRRYKVRKTVAGRPQDVIVMPADRFGLADPPASGGYVETSAPSAPNDDYS